MKNFRNRIQVFKLKELIKNLLKIFPPIWIYLSYNVYIRHGIAVYKTTKKIYGQNVQLLFCPQEGIGDAYLTGICLKAYLQKNKIHNWILLYQKGTGIHVLKLFGISRIYPLSKKERLAFQRFYWFMGSRLSDIHIVHYNIPSHSSIICSVEGIHNLNFHDMFFKVGLKLYDFTQTKPHFKKNCEYITNYFLYNNLQVGKTAIIAPYTNTLSTMPLYKWKKLAQKLLAMGYCVCTNIDRNNQQPIPDTTPLELPIEYAVPILDKAGLFIGARSGLCEVISSSTCKKIILYPHAYQYSMVAAIDFFGFKDMKLFNEFEEFEFSQLKNISKCPAELHREER